MVRREIDNDKLNQPTELTTSNSDYPAPPKTLEIFKETRDRIFRDKIKKKNEANKQKFKEDDAYYTKILDNLINDTLSVANGVDDPKQLSKIFDLGDKEWRRICFQVKKTPGSVIRLQPTAFVYNIYKLSQPKVEEEKIALSEEMPEVLPPSEIEGAGKEIIEVDMSNEFPKASKFLKDNHDKMVYGMERYISGVDPINEDEDNPITTLPLPNADQPIKTIFISRYINKCKEVYESEDGDIELVSGEMSASERGRIYDSFYKGELSKIVISKAIFDHGGVRYVDLDGKIRVVLLDKFTKEEQDLIVFRVKCNNITLINADEDLTFKRLED